MVTVLPTSEFVIENAAFVKAKSIMKIINKLTVPKAEVTMIILKSANNGMLSSALAPKSIIASKKVKNMNIIRMFRIIFP